MQALSYYLLVPFIYLVSILPLSILYLISNVIFAVLYHILGYRKNVVLSNLRNAFPEKDEKEITSIAKDFYIYLCDLIVETIKTLTISKEEMIKRCEMSDSAQQLFDRYASERKSAILVMGHYGNWEWGGNTFSILCKQQLEVIYHPLENKYFDKLMHKMRTRFGTSLITMKQTYRHMIANKEKLTLTAFIADQTPSPKNAHWTRFLNQDTPVFKGTETIAMKMNYPILYAYVLKEKRGYYKIYAEELITDPQSTDEGEISDLHTKRLEKNIIDYPATWLWSHRRWKHKRN